MSEAPAGSSTDFSMPEGGAVHDVRVLAPISCEPGDAYIQLEREGGLRRIGTKRSPQGGFDEGCMVLPDASTSSDPTVCPVINPMALMHAVETQMRTQTMQVNGMGVGPCTETWSDYDDARISIGVTDWRHADALVEMMAAELRRWDVSGTIGVAVRGIKCGTLDSPS